MIAHHFSQTPSSLFDPNKGEVNWGTFQGQVQNCNLIDIPGLYSNDDDNEKRLKEWQAFQLGNDDLFICGAIYNAKQFAIIGLAVYQRSTNSHYLYKKFVRPSKMQVADGRLPSDSHFHGGDGKLSFSMKRTEKQGCEVDIYWPGNKKLPELRLHAQLQDNFNGMTICQPFPGQRPLYSYKNLMHANAELQLGTRIFCLNSDNSYAIIDDHKGYYPQEVNYDWGTAAGYIDGRLTGFNLTRNQIVLQEKFNENCLWVDGEMHLLPAVNVTHHKDYWHFQDAFGDIDIKFYRQVENSQNVNLLFKYIDYQGPFGFFDGYIRHPDVGEIPIHRLLGMAERKRYKL